MTPQVALPHSRPFSPLTTLPLFPFSAYLTIFSPFPVVALSLAFLVPVWRALPLTFSASSWCHPHQPYHHGELFPLRRHPLPLPLFVHQPFRLCSLVPFVAPPGHASPQDPSTNSPLLIGCHTNSTNQFLRTRAQVRGCVVHACRSFFSHTPSLRLRHFSHRVSYFLVCLNDTWTLGACNTSSTRSNTTRNSTCKSVAVSSLCSSQIIM